jgi:hypothetical protein
LWSSTGFPARDAPPPGVAPGFQFPEKLRDANVVMVSLIVGGRQGADFSHKGRSADEIRCG